MELLMEASLCQWDMEIEALGQEMVFRHVETANDMCKPR